MENKIVLISCNNSNARRVCENIENNTYSSFTNLKEVLVNELGNDDDFLILSFSDFMDDVNNQILDDLRGNFITYVKIN